MKPQTQFISDQDSIIIRSILKEDTVEDNNNHYGLRDGKPCSLMSTNNLTSATRIINYMHGAPKHYRGKYLILIECNWIVFFTVKNSRKSIFKKKSEWRIFIGFNTGLFIRLSEVSGLETSERFAYQSRHCKKTHIST